MRLRRLRHNVLIVDAFVSAGTITTRSTAKKLCSPGESPPYPSHSTRRLTTLSRSEGVSAPSSLTIAYVDNSAAIEAICGKARYNCADCDAAVCDCVRGQHVYAASSPSWTTSATSPRGATII